MSRWLPEILRRPFRPLASVALLALAPKCMLCLAAYAGLGALLGFRSQEICGAAGSRNPWVSVLVGGGFALGVVGLITSRRRRRSPNESAAAAEEDGLKGGPRSDTGGPKASESPRAAGKIPHLTA